MKVKLSREDLYELVWSKPMTHASKDLDISDVMLGKMCKQLNVPRPPRGYWAAQKSITKRHKFPKAALPNLPEADENFCRLMQLEKERRNATRPDEFDPEDLSEPIPAPPEEFKESLKEYRLRLQSQIPVLPEPTEIKILHPIAQTVLDADDEVARFRKRNAYATSPKFQSEKGKLELHLLNCILLWFEMLGYTVRLSGKKNFRFLAPVPSHDREFRVFLIDHDPSPFTRKRFNEKKRTTFGFSWADQYKDVTPGRKYYDFENFTSHIIQSVILDAEVDREKEFRERVFDHYEHNVESRKWFIKHKAEQERIAGEKKKQALAAMLAKRVDLMDSAILNMQSADSIRDLIQTINTKAKKSKKPVKGLEHWVSWANHHANVIDPRNMSIDGIEAWIGKFKLRD